MAVRSVADFVEVGVERAGGDFVQQRLPYVGAVAVHQENVDRGCADIGVPASWRARSLPRLHPRRLSASRCPICSNPLRVSARPGSAVMSEARFGFDGFELSKPDVLFMHSRIHCNGSAFVLRERPGNIMRAPFAALCSRHPIGPAHGTNLFMCPSPRVVAYPSLYERERSEVRNARMRATGRRGMGDAVRDNPVRDHRGVGVLTLNRPRVLNQSAMIEEIMDVQSRVERDPEVNVWCSRLGRKEADAGNDGSARSARHP